MKITVIATGFGRGRRPRPAQRAAQTPVDMTHYTESARLRAEPAAVPSPRRRRADRAAAVDRAAAALELPVRG